MRGEAIQRVLARKWAANNPQRYCDDCLARTLTLRNVGQAKRATNALASDPGYRQEEADCSRCGATKHTTRALWAGL